MITVIQPRAIPATGATVVTQRAAPAVSVTTIGRRGPPGPVSVSTDPGNLAELGSDHLIYVDPARLEDAELLALVAL